WPILYVRFQMKNGIAKLMMTCARKLAQILDQVLAIPPPETRNNLFAQPRKKIAITRQVSAVKQRNGKLNIVRIQPFAFRQISRCWTQLQPQVPQLLRKAPYGIFEFTFGITASVQKQQINIGVGEKPASPESPGCHEHKILWKVRIGSCGIEDDLVPQPLNHRIDQRRAPCERRPPFAGHGEFPLDGSGFARVQIPQLTAYGGDGGHFVDTLLEVFSPAPALIPFCS